MIAIQPLRLSVVICTRNRPRELRRAVEAVVAAGPDAGLFVMDQSDAFESLQQPWLPGFRHLQSASRGLSRAKNEALRLVPADVVFYTDDDCLLQKGAVERVSAMFAADPELGVVYGTVEAIDSVRVDGFIPTYAPRRHETLRGRLSKLRDGGIGACMAVRRDAALAIGGFDERLGPGAALASYEDGEFTYRMLKHGFSVGHLPDATVRHEGLKPWADGPRFMYQTYRAIGAACALHLRQRDPVALLMLLQHLGRLLTQIPANFLRGKPTGFTSLRGLLSGSAVGLLTPAFSKPWQ